MGKAYDYYLQLRESIYAAVPDLYENDQFTEQHIDKVTAVCVDQILATQKSKKKRKFFEKVKSKIPKG